MIKEEGKVIFMDHKWAKYLHKHTKMITTIVVVVFLLLAAGEYYLYRQIMYLNRMVSEGFMQLKTEQNQKAPEQNFQEETPMVPPQGGGMGLPK